MSTHTIRMPDLGEGIAEVELVEWRVKVGDTVAEDQVLADVMTDKATVEIPSPVAGRVQALGGEVGQTMAVGSDLIHIEVADAAPMQAAAGGVPAPGRAAAAPAAKVAEPPAAKAAEAPAPPAVEPRPPPHLQTAPPPAAASGAAAPSRRPIASPALRARAWELGVALDEVEARGPAGRIMQADLDAHVARHGTAAPPRPALAPRGAAASGATHEVRIVGLRRKIAQKMQESKRRIPHYAYVEEVDVGEVEALRARLNEKHGAQRGHLTMLAFLIRAIVLAVREHPEINARFDDERGVLTRYEPVHLGIATQTDAGLMVPVLRDAQAHDLWVNAAEVRRLADAARSGKAVRDELSGSTITLTSLGKLGGIVSTPVINHPEVAIVGVNKIAWRPAIRDGAIVARQLMNLSSSFDHRVVDGAQGAAFIQGVREFLEHPATLFVE
jgi:2-oxoisovalerate dehydrogenase E2 component (dihydrolipoyl transacylase)